MTRGFNDVSIPAFKGIWSSSEWVWKESSDGFQYLYTIESMDALTGTERIVEARTKHVVEPISYSPWREALKGFTINWGNENNSFGVYILQIRNKTFSVTSTRYWGTWYW